MRNKLFYSAVATLIGTTMGAGILGMPYVIAKSGFLTGTLLIVCLGLLMMGLNLALGEVVLRTKGNHQLAGYAERYLGKWGKYLMSLSMVIGLYGALIAYTIAAGQSLFAIFNVASPLILSLVFFAFATVVIYYGIHVLEKVEFVFGIIMLSFLAIMIAVSLKSPSFLVENLITFNFYNLLFPFGVILFSFLGAIAIPEMKEELAFHKDQLKKAIIIGTLIPLVTYFIFSLSVVGVFGVNTTQIVTIGFGELFGSNMILLANLFALIAMITSFTAVGIALSEFYNYDCKFSKFYSFFLVSLVTLIFILSGITDFTKTIGFVGTLSGGIEGILIVLMFWQAQKLGDRVPEYTLGRFKVRGVALILVFFVGISYLFFG